MWCFFRLLFFTAFNILVNFGIAITYPKLISLGIVLSVPVNASKSLGFAPVSYSYNGATIEYFRP